MPATPISFGTAHLYGIAGTITGVTVADFKLKGKHANVDKTVNEQGNEIERRYDDLHQDASITVILRDGYTSPEPGDTIVYGGNTYEVVDVDHTEQAKGARRETYNLTRSQYVSYGD